MLGSIYIFAKSDVLEILRTATPEGKAILAALVLFSIFAWMVMASKATQMRRAKKLNTLFEAEFRTQKHVLDVYDRRGQGADFPLFLVFHDGVRGHDNHLENPLHGTR